jgi:hypothetical protein
MALDKRKKTLRLAVLLAGGGLLITAASILRPTLLKIPAPAPLAVQQDGAARIDRILLAIAKTRFGASSRGTQLREAVDHLRASGALIFTADISEQAKYFEYRIGRDILYVRVLRGASGRYTHQGDEGIAQSIFHEAVHALRPGSAGSIEEECDGYAAGFAAGSAVLGTSLAIPILMDGKPVAQFVRSAYPELEQNSDYQPVGQSREWLMQRTGLE